MSADKHPLNSYISNLSHPDSQNYNSQSSNIYEFNSSLVLDKSTHRDLDMLNSILEENNRFDKYNLKLRKTKKQRLDDSQIGLFDSAKKTLKSDKDGSQKVKQKLTQLEKENMLSDRRREGVFIGGDKEIDKIEELGQILTFENTIGNRFKKMENQMEDLNEVNDVLLTSPEFKNLQKERQRRNKENSKNLNFEQFLQNKEQNQLAPGQRIGFELMSLINNQSSSSKNDKNVQLLQEKFMKEINNLTKKLSQLEEENMLLEGWNKEVEHENVELTHGLTEYEESYKNKSKELEILKKEKIDYINRIAMFTRQISEIKYSSNYSSKYASQDKKYSSIQKLINKNIEMSHKLNPMGQRLNLANIKEKELEKTLDLDNSDISQVYTEYQDEQIRTEMIKMFKSQKKHLQSIETLKDQVRKFRKAELKQKVQIDQHEQKFKQQRVAYEKRILKIFDEKNEESSEQTKTDLMMKLNLETKIQDLESEIQNMKFKLDQKDEEFQMFKIDKMKLEKQLDSNQNQAMELVKESQGKSKAIVGEKNTYFVKILTCFRGPEQKN